MGFYSVKPTKRVYSVEVNSKVLDSKFESLVDAEETAKAYEAEGFKVMIFPTERQINRPKKFL
jgi:hypothetical protein